MKKIFFLFLIGALLLAACKGTDDETVPVPMSGGEVEAPPAITLMQGGKNFEGVEGSYCYGPQCIDKIAPADLIRGMEFQTVDEDVFFVKTGANAKDFIVKLLSEKGDPIQCYVRSEEITESDYKIDLCGTQGSGDFILSVYAQYIYGDVTYFFPIQIN